VVIIPGNQREEGIEGYRAKDFEKRKVTVEPIEYFPCTKNSVSLPKPLMASREVVLRLVFKTDRSLILIRSVTEEGISGYTKT